MLLSSVIIVLREVLEAAILISMLLVLSNRLNLSGKWLWWAMVTGFLGALIYSSSVAEVSDWFDGVGQEIVNASLQIAIYGLLAAILFMLAANFSQGKTGTTIMTLLMGLAVSLAVVREGFEFIIYLVSFSTASSFTGVIVGSIIGAGIGLSVGVLLYYFLVGMSLANALIMGAIFLIFVAAAMLSQATLLLIQADFLNAQLPLWDSSFLLSESSLAGQLLYAFIGYEATPTPLQMQVYAGGIALLLVLIAIGRNKQMPVCDENS